MDQGGAKEHSHGGGQGGKRDLHSSKVSDDGFLVCSAFQMRNKKTVRVAEVVDFLVHSNLRTDDRRTCTVEMVGGYRWHSDINLCNATNYLVNVNWCIRVHMDVL